MAELLEKIYAEQDWKTDPTEGAERAAYYRDPLAKRPDLRTQLKIRVVLAETLLRAGYSVGAVEDLEKIRSIAKEKTFALTPRFESEVRDALAISYLRLGEEENCLNNHCQSSCLFPIQSRSQCINSREAARAPSAS